MFFIWYKESLYSHTQIWMTYKEITCVVQYNAFEEINGMEIILAVKTSLPWTKLAAKL